MNPLRFSEILKDLPDEFIESAANPHSGHAAGSGTLSERHSVSAQTDAAVSNETIARRSRRSAGRQKDADGDFSAPRWITFTATAASLLFAVGFGAVIISGSRDDPSTFSTEDSAYSHDFTAERVTEVSAEDTSSAFRTTALTISATQPSTAPSASDSVRQTVTEAVQPGSTDAAVQLNADTASDDATLPQPPVTAAGRQSADTASDDATQTRPPVTAAVPAETTASAGSQAVTTTAASAEVPDILLQYCQTLEDGIPLRMDARTLSYHDGSDYTPISAETGKRYPNDAQFPLTGMYIEIGCAEGAPGETVTVPVYISGVPELNSFTLFIDPPEGPEPEEILSSAVQDYGAAAKSNLPKGSLVVASLEIMNPPDGYVIAYYSYTIPEDAQPGTLYPLVLNFAKSIFVAAGEDTYQYSLLSGVIAVGTPGQNGT